jgi:murein hydrolase activator
MRLVLFFLIVFCAAAPVWAGQAETLRRVESDLVAKRAEQRRYAAQQAEIEKKLDAVRDHLREVTSDVQNHERALLKLRTRQEATKTEMAAVEKQLTGQRQALAQLVMALQRLSRMPPQALLARPGAPVDTARSYLLLQEVIPNVSKQAREVKDTLDKLALLVAEAEKQQAALTKETKTLTKKQKAFQQIIDQREALLAATGARKERADANVAALSRRAKDLRDLLNSITHDEAPSKTPGDIGAAKKSGLLASWFGKDSRLPVTGTVTAGYGQTLSGGGTSQGLTISAAGGAIVTAPGAGVVRFAGPFRQYKLLVIIQHASGEHSLLGGLHELYTRIGDRIDAGEPLGKLSGDSGQTASLYYERRRHGKPIDPRSAKG